MTVQEEEDPCDDADRLYELEWHGFKAVAQKLTPDGRNAAETLLAAAAEKVDYSSWAVTATPDSGNGYSAALPNSCWSTPGTGADGPLTMEDYTVPPFDKSKE